MKSVVHLITTIARGGAENQLKVVVREQVRSGFKVKVIYLKDFPELRQELQNSGAEVIDILGEKIHLSSLGIIQSPFFQAHLLSSPSF